jgi:hypothetical protein
MVQHSNKSIGGALTGQSQAGVQTVCDAVGSYSHDAQRSLRCTSLTKFGLPCWTHTYWDDLYGRRDGIRSGRPGSVWVDC